MPQNRNLMFRTVLIVPSLSKYGRIGSYIAVFMDTEGEICARLLWFKRINQVNCDSDNC